MSFIYILLKINRFSNDMNNKTILVGIFQKYQYRLQILENEYNLEESPRYIITKNNPDISYNNQYHEKNYICDIFNDYYDTKYIVYKIHKNDNIYDFNGLDCLEWYDFQLDTDIEEIDE